MEKKTIFITILSIFTCLLIAVNVFTIYTYSKEANIYLQAQTSRKILDFRNTFEEQILLANKEIDFDTRLSLETAVRALNDKEIFAQWQKFTNSQTKQDATTQAKALLELLIIKTAN
ncbi:MAG: hypothetical protein NTY04_04190 [Candidatus Staskawiczbacteria bacterium]|nr:hypothetical protein [Candidatus Staskawiczbacteria bacterium]